MLPPYFFKYKSSLLLNEFFNQVGKRNVFRRIALWGRQFVKKEVRSRLVSWCSLTIELKWISSVCYILQMVYYIFFHRTSLPSLEHVQSCKSRLNLLFLVLFSCLSNLFFLVYFRKKGSVIDSWELLCARHILMFLKRILDVSYRLMKQIL